MSFSFVTWLRNAIPAHVALVGKAHQDLGGKESDFNCRAENLHSMKKREASSTVEISSLVLTKVLTFQLDCQW